MTNLFKKLFLPLSLVLAVFSANASHVPGGNITYECIGPNTYVITLTLYEDCGTAFTGTGNQTIQASNDCGLTNPTISLTNTIFQQEVSQLCPAQIGQSECNGGTLPGIYMHQWQATITLPGPCDSWTFAYSSCCRNTSTNVSGQPGYYWESVLNSQTAPCNTSPIVTAQPIPYVCSGQPVSYNLGASEPDGHTLQYSLIGAQSAAGTIVTYNGGYSAAVPIPGIAIDPNTGQITFTPGAVGNYIVAILIEEYDANGNLVGSIIHDIQFEVINCSNTNPNLPVAGITNYTGSGGLIGTDAVQVCEGDNFCFDVVFDDPDATNTLTVTSNVTTVLPGATISITGTNPVTATVCWTAQPGMPAFNSFILTVEDDGCPINGLATFPVEVLIISSTYAGPDMVMCDGSGVQLNASGGTNFSWSLVSGDPITPANFSCTNCQDPVANPAFTSTYEVVSNLTGGCVNVDTITVTVVPDFTYIATQSSGTSCLLDPVQVQISPTPAGAYIYSWTPTGGGLSPTNVANPVINQTIPGNYTYYVDIVSPQGCLKQDSVTVSVAASYAPQISAFADADTINCGDVVNFDVDLGGGIPATCGPSTSGGCAPGSGTPMTIGTQTGTNSSTGWPSPYGNWYANARHQFLFTAAELNAGGFIGGKIQQIIWATTAQNGAQTTFINYTIKMGCTNLTALPTTFQTGLNTVFGPQNINVVLGNNTHTLSTPYEWDGVSNLIVEICYEWTAQYNYTYNWTTPYTTTPFNSSLYYYSDGTAACPQPTGFTSSPNRPITTFVTCPSTPDPNNYTFNWTPSTGTNAVNNASIQQPTASPYYSQWYTVTVTDINGGCTDVDSVFVFTDCCDPSDVITVATSCNGGSDGEISISPQGNNAPFNVDVIDDATGTVVFNDPAVALGGNVTATGLPAGQYSIQTLDQTLCLHDTTVIITEPPAVTVSATDTTICETGTVTLVAQGGAGDGGPYTYNWVNVGTGTPSVNPGIDTCYSVYVNDATGCSSDTAQLCVTILPSLASTVSSNLAGACPGAPINLTGAGNGGNGGPYTLSWIEGTNNVGSGTNVTVNPINPGNPESDYVTTYCVIVDDGCETPNDTACIDITTFAVPDVSFTSDIVDGCYPITVSFINTTNPSFTGNCVWDFGNGLTSNNCDETNVYDTPGAYTVTLTVTSPNGCTSDTVATNYISVYSYPQADFDYNPQVGTVLNSEITFTNLSTDNYTNFWVFGAPDTLGTSFDEDPLFTFPVNNPGTYDVTLYIENQFGCADTISQLITIQGIFTLYVPNAFTPDGDGINEVFMAKGEGAEPDEFVMYIYNRWGELIFTTEDINTGWDGNYRGFAAPDGVYVWKIKTVDRFTGEEKEFVGHVTLLR